MVRLIYYNAQFPTHVNSLPGEWGTYKQTPAQYIGMQHTNTARKRKRRERKKERHSDTAHSRSGMLIMLTCTTESDC